MPKFYRFLLYSTPSLTLWVSWWLRTNSILIRRKEFNSLLTDQNLLWLQKRIPTDLSALSIRIRKKSLFFSFVRGCGMESALESRSLHSPVWLISKESKTSINSCNFCSVSFEVPKNLTSTCYQIADTFLLSSFSHFLLCANILRYM